MANEDHLARLQQAVEAWNAWRSNNPGIAPDLYGADLAGATLAHANLAQADLTGANLGRADLAQANLTGANLTGANLAWATLSEATLTEATLTGTNLAWADLGRADLTQATLTGADLTGADLGRADLSGADLSGADLSGTDLTGANLGRADLTQANLTGASLGRANLQAAVLVETNFAGAHLTGCAVYGIAARNINLAAADHTDLVITRPEESVITVDHLEVAQFISFLLHHEKIREVIGTIGQQGVLILGRFAGERKAVLNALREALRHRGFLPMVFDFEQPTQRDFTETIMTLAGLSLFVIADITNPRSAPLELQATVPDYMIPFVPIIAEGEEPFAMFIDLQRQFDWVLEVLTYDSTDHLLAGLQDAVITPALQKHGALVERRARVVGTRHIHQYLPHGEARP
jgi:uncharacterized protein YjbI with pentapeptide repeats